MEKKKLFDKPEAEIVKFDNNDIIVTSAGGPNNLEDPDKQWEF